MSIVELNQVVISSIEYQELLEYKRYWWIGIFCLSMCVFLILALIVVTI